MLALHQLCCQTAFILTNKEEAIKIVEDGGEMLSEVEQDLEFVTESFIATEQN